MRNRAVAVLAALLLPVGCGEGDEPSAEPAKTPVEVAGTVPTPDDGGLKPMEPGEYRSSKFRPPVRFRLTRPMWQKEFETPDSLALYSWGDADYEPDEAILHILRPGGVFDVEDASDPDGRPWPRDVIAWLRKQPNIEVGPERRGEVGGRPARVVDIQTKDHQQLFVDSAGEMPAVSDDFPVRLYVLGSGRKQRAVMLNGGGGRFELLEEIVATIRFEDG